MNAVTCAPRTYSVVIPVHNRPHLLRDAVSSAFRQSLPPIEVIVVDDGSQPPLSLDINQHGILTRIVRLGTNQGAAKARNVGAGLAKGSHLAFLDSDDVWRPDHLARIDRSLNERPDAGFAYSWCTVAGGMSPFPLGALRLRRLHSKRLSWPPPSLHTPAVVVERELFFVIGEFAEQLRYRQDTDLWIRLFEESTPAKTRRVTVEVRYQDNGNSARAKKDPDLYREIYFEVVNRQIQRGLSSGRLSSHDAQALVRETHRYWCKTFLSRGRLNEAWRDARMGYLRRSE